MNKLDLKIDLRRPDLKERFRQTKAIISAIAAGGEIEFYDVSYDAIVEVFGKIKKTDFDGISDMAGFFANKQNIIREIIKEHRRRAD